MKMITRCPACATLFKVVPDQLRIAQGWVRCGQCMATFDAREYMLPADPDDADAPGEPPDSGWRDLPPTPGDTLSSRRVADTADADAPSSLAADVPAANPRPVETPEPRSGSWDIEAPAFAVPAFGLPRSSPARLVAGPAPDASPARTVAPGMPVAPDRAVASAPPVSIPTPDDLDRRHARLIEVLARLRENPDRSKDEDGHGVPDDDRAGHGASRSVRRRDVSTERELKRGREDDARERVGRETSGKNRGVARDSRDRKPDGGPASRPMIDFVLSEMGQSSSSSVLSRAEIKPAPSGEEVPAFVEQARRRAFWALPRVRTGLRSVAVALAVLFVAQIAVSQRDRLAAQFPGTAPLLAALCHPLQCRIEPWRHLDAVVIDSSSFVRTGLGSFNFAVTLRNNGDAPVATPALELMLTDAQDQPLVRRVLDPAVWGAPPQLAAHGEFNGAALLTVLDAANPQVIGSYRLTAFYP